MNVELNIRKTDIDLPNEKQDVLYYFEPFKKWFPGKFDGDWCFYGEYGFGDGHDVPYWIALDDIPHPPERKFTAVTD